MTGNEPAELFSAGEAETSPPLQLRVSVDLAHGCLDFRWFGTGRSDAIARGRLTATGPLLRFFNLDWVLEADGTTKFDHCTHRGTSARAFVNRVRKLFSVADNEVHIGIVAHADFGMFKKGAFCPLDFSPETPWKCLTRFVQEFANEVEALQSRTALDPTIIGVKGLMAATGKLVPAVKAARATMTPVDAMATTRRVCVTFNMIQGFAQLDWIDAAKNEVLASGCVRCTGLNELTWELTFAGTRETVRSSQHRNFIRSRLSQWRERFESPNAAFTVVWVKSQPNSPKPLIVEESPFGPEESPWPWVEENIQAMAQALRCGFSPLGNVLSDIDPLTLADVEREERRLSKLAQKRTEHEKRMRENMAHAAEERRRREQHAEETKKAAAARKGAELVSPQLTSERLPLPAVPVRTEFPQMAFQETAFPLENLRSYFLCERAARWWISNQSDDLLSLPYCSIERLDYQIRTALRVIGPLRGRALLSDEVGLGKTIEAGLVLKEYLTRGMIKRFLILTVPSLVDQWEEELASKFNLTTATTNHPSFRADANSFWQQNSGVIASLHTLKQPAHLSVAQQITWDMLVIDEAHYLRNRTSQAWQAVNVLPRQFLLLLTATPVQNSLEDLYNLVTLLQPGQLPSPKEFRSRFVDPKRPHQPREPEELRRLLSQVMIRNTRANTGINLPPRRAETVLFAPDDAERAFWQQWEGEFRQKLASFTASQSSLWGRLLLQAAGSSPAAWRDALESFPDRAAARAWREAAPLESSWLKKADSLVSLAKSEGGVVIFTQFLKTQADLAERLRAVGVPTWVINGQTPPAARQPITEEFRRQAGALLLTHSGTEGRNLQFCHRLVNFDLPWNPMEIEQRIGRLHRLGQEHPVRIYNLVQAGTLQEHLLQILQEKLNLFELVVGETGLILGERFSSDEFAEEILNRWREGEGRVAEAMQSLGEELAAARASYGQVKQLDETLFAKDYESL